jgi:hypothetical protein
VLSRTARRALRGHRDLRVPKGLRVRLVPKDLLALLVRPARRVLQVLQVRLGPQVPRALLVPLALRARMPVRKVRRGHRDLPAPRVIKDHRVHKATRARQVQLDLLARVVIRVIPVLRACRGPSDRKVRRVTLGRPDLPGLR